MNYRTLTICTLVVTFMATSMRFMSRPQRIPANAPTQGVTSPNTMGGRASSPASGPISQATPAITSADYNFRAEILDLLAPFEIDDGDPFLREKRSAAFQAQIDSLDQSELPLALEAAKFVCSENPTEASTDLLERLERRWSKLDPINDSPKIAPELSLTAKIISLSDTDPIAAATITLQQLPSNQDQQNILVGSVQRWAARDYNAALSWVEQFPQGGLRTRAFNELRRFCPPTNQDTLSSE
jgi:hypothetical protein